MPSRVGVTPKKATFVLPTRILSNSSIVLCKDQDIFGIPSFVAYNDKEESGRFVSKLRKTKEEIQAFIDTLK